MIPTGNHKFKGWLHDLAFPLYNCEDCLGVGFQYPCYCAHYGAQAPGEPPDWWREKLRRVLSLPGPRELYARVCQAMPTVDDVEELEAHELHFVVLVTTTLTAVTFKFLQVLL